MHIVDIYPSDFYDALYLWPSITECGAYAMTPPVVPVEGN